MVINKQWMTNALLVARGLRAVLILPQNRNWARTLLALFIFNLLLYVFGRIELALPGQAAAKLASEHVSAELITVETPWGFRGHGDHGEHGDTHSSHDGEIKVISCRRWGPFNAMDLRRVDQLLSEWGGQRKLITETEPIAYQVYWPDSAKNSATFMKELRVAGFADALVSSGEDVTKGHVSYGAFRSRAQAREKIAFLTKKGFAGAVIYTRMGPPKTVYELRGDPDQMEALFEIRNQYDFGEYTGCTPSEHAEAAH
jgi:hypothetical protein